jgi:RNA polymerase sigma-70 factor (ECF subfamily)
MMIGNPPGETRVMTVDTGTVAAVDELRAALASDGAFEAWYRRCVPRVYSYLLARTGSHELAEELSQEVFATAIARRAGPDVRSDTVGWLLGIARHKLADHYRALDRGDRRRLRLEVRELLSGERARSFDEAASERIAITAALNRLPPLQRAILVFVALDDLPVAEAARLIGRSHAAAQSLLFRAREGFRREYGEGRP